MTAFEIYRLNVPIFAPSWKLLVEWQLAHNVVWERVYGHPARASDLPPTPVPSPNSDEKAAIQYWFVCSLNCLLLLKR